MLVSTVICTYNRVDILKICLEHVVLQTCDPSKFEVLIINNNSTDTTEEYVKTFISEYSGNIKFSYFLEKKQGLSAARNKGLHQAEGQWINYIDDDALLPPDFIANVIQNINKHPAIGGFGGKIIPKYFGSEPEWMSWFTWGLVSKHDLGNQPKQYESIGIYPTGCNMTYKKSALLEVGGFDEVLLRRCDDKYIAYEIKSKNYQIWYFPDVVLEHYIDEDRINNRLSYICQDTGTHEKWRLRNKSGFVSVGKFLEYLAKMFAALAIGGYYFLKGLPTKGWIIIKMRWWFLQGYIKA